MGYVACVLLVNRSQIGRHNMLSSLDLSVLKCAVTPNCRYPKKPAQTIILPHLTSLNDVPQENSFALDLARVLVGRKFSLSR